MEIFPVRTLNTHGWFPKIEMPHSPYAQIGREDHSDSFQVVPFYRSLSGSLFMTPITQHDRNSPRRAPRGSQLRHGRRPLRRQPAVAVGLIPLIQLAALEPI